MLAKSETFPHTRAMSEIGEISQGPEPQGQPMRLEDRPEFQALAPEQQEKLLALRERLMAEAANPENVVSRSINEMGFWEGLKHTVKPHMAKQKEIMFKELKAGASLAISLVPVLGEGKGIGTGLFGLATKDGSVITKATNLGNIKFEPFVRLGNAAAKGKEAFNAAKVAPKSADLLWKFGKTNDKNILVRGAVKTADVIDRVGAHAKDALRPATILLGAKGAAEHSLGAASHAAAAEGADAMAKTFKVEKVYEATKAKKMAKQVAYSTTKAAEEAKRGIQNRKWWELPKQWKAIGAEIAAKRARREAGKLGNVAIKQAIEAGFEGRKVGKARKVIESGIKKVSPAVIEGTRFGQYKAFFERWLNLTPDVPVWISTTTGVAEFLGAHGIDAIPAVMQMGINRYQQLKVSKDMGLDVLAYVATRALGKLAERKRAAQVFRPQEAAAVV